MRISISDRNDRLLSSHAPGQSAETVTSKAEISLDLGMNPHPGSEVIGG